MQMKKVIAGCIDLMLEFDSASELDRYIADIEAKKQEYIALLILTKKVLESCIDVLGFEAPERM